MKKINKALKSLIKKTFVSPDYRPSLANKLFCFVFQAFQLLSYIYIYVYIYMYIYIYIIIILYFFLCFWGGSHGFNRFFNRFIGFPNEIIYFSIN